jgi:putative ABC transport system permease protein
MTFRQLAANNVRGSWRRYLAYFLSCTFSVTVFYLFAAFILNNEVRTGRIVASARIAVTGGLVACEVIILIFSFLFVIYSNTAFLRSRKKEFGLFTLMGMTRAQMRKLTFIESMVVAMAATVTGLALGVLLSKLFLMGMTAMMGLGEAIPFAIPLAAVGLTIAVFSLMFLALTLLSLIAVGRNSIRELLVAHHEPRPLPKFRPVLLVLGVLLIAAGYYLAVVTTGPTFVINMFPTIGLTVAGTYFLFSQGGVALCGLLKRRPWVYLHSTNMLSISRLTFRLKDNARILFVTATLIAVVVSALGACNTLLQNARAMATDTAPFALSFEHIGASPAADALRATTDEKLRQRGITNVISFQSEALKSDTLEILVVPQSAYDRARQVVKGLDDFRLVPGELALGRAFAGDQLKTSPGEPFTLNIEGNAVTFRSIGTVNAKFWPGRSVAVFNDSDYEALAVGVPLSQRQMLFGFEYKGWERREADAAAVWNEVRDEQSTLFFNRAEGYGLLRQSGALTLFIGVFVSFLFFVASGALIYFKLYTEIQDDRREFRTLQKIGITIRETRRVANQELGTLFFLPLLVGFVHSAFALKTLRNLVSMDIVKAGITVMTIYLASQAVYFWLTRTAYLKQLQDV